MTRNTRFIDEITNALEHTKNYDRNISSIIYDYACPGEADIAYVKKWNIGVWKWRILFEITRMERTRNALLKLGFVPIEYTEDNIAWRRTELRRFLHKRGIDTDSLDISNRKMKYYYKCWQQAYYHYSKYYCIVEEWLNESLYIKHYISAYCEDLEISIEDVFET